MDLNVLTKGKNFRKRAAHPHLFGVSYGQNRRRPFAKNRARALYFSSNTGAISTKIRFFRLFGITLFLKNRLNRQMTTEAAIDYQINTEGIAASIDAIKEIYAQNNDKFITIYATGFSGIIAEYLHKKCWLMVLKLYW